MQKYLSIHLQGSIKTALVVGTILTFINHTKAILNIEFDAYDLLNWSLNYVVPFTVSLYSRIISQKNLSKTSS
jgi:hypothetical protein